MASPQTYLKQLDELEKQLEQLQENVQSLYKEGLDAIPESDKKRIEAIKKQLD